MTEHGALTIIADIKSGMQQALMKELAAIENSRNDVNGSIPFPLISSIHFSRFVVLDNRQDTAGNALAAQLVFTTNYDLPEQQHIQQLIHYAGPGLWRVFSHCVHFPAGPYHAAQLQQYLTLGNITPATFYVGVGRRSVTQIRKEKLLREEIERFADVHYHEFKVMPALAVRKKITDHLATTADYAWALTPEPEATTAWKWRHYAKLVAGAAGLLVLAIVLLPLLLIWILIIFIDEVTHKPARNIVTKQHLRDLTDRETGMVQAQFSAVGNIKPGWFRLKTVQFLLALTNFLAPYLFSKGRLSGIPTVHFARWLIINNGRQMLFLSNYDGNSESYLTDFINIAAKQLTLLFSHTINYPQTYLMVFGGAKNAKQFMEWARHHQVVTQVWYTANKEVTVKNVYSNALIRKGLSGVFTEKEALQWLSLI